MLCLLSGPGPTKYVQFGSIALFSWKFVRILHHRPWSLDEIFSPCWYFIRVSNGAFRVRWCGGPGSGNCEVDMISALNMPSLVPFNRLMLIFLQRHKLILGYIPMTRVYAHPPINDTSIQYFLLTTSTYIYIGHAHMFLVLLWWGCEMMKSGHSWL